MVSARRSARCPRRSRWTWRSRRTCRAAGARDDLARHDRLRAAGRALRCAWSRSGSYPAARGDRRGHRDARAATRTAAHRGRSPSGCASWPCPSTPTWTTPRWRSARSRRLRREPVADRVDLARARGRPRRSPGRAGGASGAARCRRAAEPLAQPLRIVSVSSSSGSVLRRGCRPAGGRVDPLVVDGRDDVALLEAGLRGRAAREDGRSCDALAAAR